MGGQTTKNQLGFIVWLIVVAIATIVAHVSQIVHVDDITVIAVDAAATVIATSAVVFPLYYSWGIRLMTVIHHWGASNVNLHCSLVKVAQQLEIEDDANQVWYIGWGDVSQLDEKLGG